MLRSLSVAFATAALLCGPVFSATIADNLANSIQSTEFIGSNTWIGAQFGTSGTASTLSSITILINSTAPGAARLDLYTDSLSAPGVVTGTLLSPSAYSTTLSPTTFGGNNLLLQPNSLYWAVLKSAGGEFEWGWTQSTTGNGSGFRTSWGATDDAGSSWFVSPSQPMLMRVVVDDATIIPEPATLALFALLGLPAVTVLRKLKSKGCLSGS